MLQFFRCFKSPSTQIFSGDFSSKEKLMRKFKFACLDLISSVEITDKMEADIVGNGYQDKNLFKSKTKTYCNTENIISIIRNKKIKKSYCKLGSFVSCSESKISERRGTYRNSKN